MRRTDAPAWLLDFFRFDRDRGVVRWATHDDLRVEPPRKVKRIPFGVDAGGRDVVGHGKLVAFSGRNLLTCDIRAAILDGVQWPWDAAKRYVVPHEPGVLPRTNAARVDFIQDTWRLDGDGVVWRRDTPPQYPANAVVVGSVIAGRNELMVTRKGVGYMLKDIVYVLQHGTMPGQHVRHIDWD